MQRSYLGRLVVEGSRRDLTSLNPTWPDNLINILLASLWEGMPICSSFLRCRTVSNLDIATAAVAVFRGGVHYHFNPAMTDRAAAQAQALSMALGEARIFPQRLELPSLNQTREFRLARE